MDEASWVAGSFVVGRRAGNARESTEVLLDAADDLQAAEAAAFPFGLGQRRGRWRGWGWEWFQANASDVEVFLEAIQLEEVGEFQGADIAAAVADLALEVGNDAAQVLEGKAGPQLVMPLVFAVKAQAQRLAGQLAVELVGGGDLGEPIVGLRMIHGWGGAGGGSKPGTQGTCWRATWTWAGVIF